MSPIGTLKLRKFKWRASSLRAELFIMLLYLTHCMGFGGVLVVFVLFCFVLPKWVDEVQVSGIGKKLLEKAQANNPWED